MDEKQPDSSRHPDNATDPAIAALRAKALSSPIRWRILRLCLHTARTNKELAEDLAVNPGSMLHHVRTLVSAGYLAAQEPRRGARNSVEIPYLATQLTWDTANQVPQVHSIMVELLRQETEDLAQHDVQFWRLGVRLSPSEVDELRQRINALFEEYKERSARGGPDGQPMSLMAFMHPDALQGPPG